MLERDLPDVRGVRVELCGRVACEIDGRPSEGALRGRQSELLLAYLVLHRGRAVRRDELIGAVWGDDPPPTAQDALNTLVSRMRKSLGAEVIAGRSTLRLELGAGAIVDREAAAEAVERAEHSIADASWSAAYEAATQALAVAEREFVPGAEVAWVEEERRRLDELRLRALECVAAAGLGLGGAHLSAAERAARSIVEAAAFRETGYGYLMQVLAQRGRTAEALQVFESARFLFSEELGTVPGAELRSLHEQLLTRDVPDARPPREDPLAVGGPAASVVAEAPRALPSPLTLTELTPFVGRAAELDRLRSCFDRAAEGAGQVVMVCGEPGIGKTRLASELALGVHGQGATVLYGRCDEEPLLPHQPFVEALQTYVATSSTEVLASQSAAVSGELQRMLPELAHRLPSLPEPLEGDPDGARYRLFEAVSALLCAAARRRPVLLVLDDLHWADRPTLLLLRHLARASRRSALLVLGTYREDDLGPDDPLAATVADLQREQRAERRRLGRLDTAAVAELVERHSGIDGFPGLDRMVHEGTEGNPFFVVEALRHLAEQAAVRGDGAAGGVPSDLTPSRLALTEGVKTLIWRRLARLGKVAERVLTNASVVGVSFEMEVLRRVCDLDEDALVDSLDAAIRARIIEEVPGSVGRYTFSHALIRETLYDSLTAVRRALLHRRVAAGIEAAHGSDLDPHRAELAHHLAQAGSIEDLDKAIEHGARAGERATALLAYEQAAAHYRSAVHLITAVDLPRRFAQRCDLVIAQGEAERRAGDPAFRRTLLEGGDLAQELGDSERLARAALANTRGMFSSALGVDRERVEVLEAALKAQDPGDSPTRAALLAQLAVELVVDPDSERRAGLSETALDMARRIGDPRTLALTLNQRYVALFGPRTLAARHDASRESGHLAQRLGDPLLSAYGAYFGALVAMEVGDLARADELLGRLADVAEQLRQPTLSWYHGMCCAKRLLIGGPPIEAERAAATAFELGQRAGQPDAFALFMNQLFWARLLRGTLDADGPDLPALFSLPGSFAVGEDFIPSRSVQLGADAIKSVTFCEVGRIDDARRHFEALMGGGLDLQDDFAMLAIPAAASLACARLRDAERASELYALIEPFAGQFVDWGPSWIGAATHHLALLSATMRRFDEAHARFAETVRVYEEVGAPPWRARAQVEWAELLQARGIDGDAERAHELLSHAGRTADELDLRGLGRRASAALAS